MDGNPAQMAERVVNFHLYQMDGTYTFSKQETVRAPSCSLLQKEREEKEFSLCVRSLFCFMIWIRLLLQVFWKDSSWGQWMRRMSWELEGHPGSSRLWQVASPRCSWLPSCAVCLVHLGSKPFQARSFSSWVFVQCQSRWHVEPGLLASCCSTNSGDKALCSLGR